MYIESKMTASELKKYAKLRKSGYPREKIWTGVKRRLLVHQKTCKQPNSAQKKRKQHLIDMGLRAERRAFKKADEWVAFKDQMKKSISRDGEQNLRCKNFFIKFNKNHRDAKHLKQGAKTENQLLRRHLGIRRPFCLPFPLPGRPCPRRNASLISPGTARWTRTTGTSSRTPPGDPA